jgi:hypothetical protein
MFIAVNYERPIPPMEDGGGAIFDEQNGDDPTADLGDQFDITSDLFGDFLEEPATPTVEGEPVDTADTTGASRGSNAPVMRVVSPEAKHSCSFDPFSLGVQAGKESAIFAMTLVPSRPNAPFEIEVGNLPPGVNASINRESGVGTFRPRVTLFAERSVVPGSYTITVFYNETQNGGGMLTAACKLNFIVD